MLEIDWGITIKFIKNYISLRLKNKYRGLNRIIPQYLYNNSFVSVKIRWNLLAYK